MRHVTTVRIYAAAFLVCLVVFAVSLWQLGGATVADAWTGVGWRPW